MVNYCDDPLKKHKKKVSNNLRTISKEVHKVFNGILPKTTVLCNNCRTTLSKNPSLLEELLTAQSESEASSTADSTGFQDGGDFEIDGVLKALDVSPIKKRKLGNLDIFINKSFVGD